MAALLELTGKLKGASACYRDVFRNSVRLMGPFDDLAHTALKACFRLLQQLGKDLEATSLRRRAASLGCDVSELVVNNEAQ